eukprot:750459-Pleurochrysis_carterae.AAC.4
MRARGCAAMRRSTQLCLRGSQAVGGVGGEGSMLGAVGAGPCAELASSGDDWDAQFGVASLASGPTEGRHVVSRVACM